MNLSKDFSELVEGGGEAKSEGKREHLKFEMCKVHIKLIRGVG